MLFMKQDIENIFVSWSPGELEADEAPIDGAASDAEVNAAPDAVT